MLKRLFLAVIAAGFLAFNYEAKADSPSLADIISQLTAQEADCILNSDVMEDEASPNALASKYCCKTASGKVEEITTCYGCNNCVKRASCMNCCKSKCRNKADREGCEGGCPS